MNRACDVCHEPAELTSDGGSWEWRHLQGDPTHPAQVPLDEVELALQRLMRSCQRVTLGLAMGGPYFMLPLLLQGLEERLDAVVELSAQQDASAGFPGMDQRMSTFDVTALGGALGDRFPEQWR